ncbi:glycosyltransferase [Roseomonas sp. WA12]
MRILFASTPILGCLNPLLAVARHCLARGDEVVVVTATVLRAPVHAAGARFLPLAEAADLDYTRLHEIVPECGLLPPGPGKMRCQFEHLFLDMMLPQAATLQQAIAQERPDLIVVDNLFFGAMPLMLNEHASRPPIVVLGITPMTLDRPDGSPVMLGLPPTSNRVERARYAAIAAEVKTTFLRPVQSYANALLAGAGLPPLPCSVLHSHHTMADIYLQLTVPGFEYDYGALPPQIRFVGALPVPRVELPRPGWWEEVGADGRRIVLVTQGTVANHDFGQLVQPALKALHDHDDFLVLVSTGGRPIESIRGPIPRNARLAKFFDFGALLPKVDVLVTNGGYGTVSLALRAGVPVVAAGCAEDKAEVGARVAWSGAGVEIPSQAPDALALRSAINRVLSWGAYRTHARALASEFAAFDTPRLILDAMDDLVGKGQAYRNGASATWGQSRAA